MLSHYEVLFSQDCNTASNRESQHASFAKSPSVERRITLCNSDLDCSSSPCLSGGESKAETGATNELCSTVAQTALI